MKERKENERNEKNKKISWFDWKELWQHIQQTMQALTSLSEIHTAAPSPSPTCSPSIFIVFDLEWTVEIAFVSSLNHLSFSSAVYSKVNIEIKKKFLHELGVIVIIEIISKID